MKKSVPLIGAILVAACTFQNPVRVTPTIQATSAPREAPEGRYVLVFDPGGAKLSRTVRSSGISCPWDVYPVNVRTATLELTGRAPVATPAVTARVNHRKLSRGRFSKS